MKIKPLYDRIIVQPEEQEVSKSGIFLGTNNQDSPISGIVLYVGDGNESQDGKKLEMHIKPKDKILFNKFSGVEALLDNKKVYILRQTDALAIIEN